MILLRSRQVRLLLVLFLGIVTRCFAGDIDARSVVAAARPNYWNTFSLADVRLLPGSPFYKAMQVDQQYMLAMDVNRMLNWLRKRAGLAAEADYPGSSQPKDTRPGDLNHYLSALSLMYAQTGDQRFLDRSNYIVNVLKQCDDLITAKIQAGDSTLHLHYIIPGWQKILKGELHLFGPDESGYPWAGTTGNDFYTIHKEMAALRDAYIYCNNTDAFSLLKKEADSVAAFVLKANPDLFDDLLDIEHGGMNEVYADMYALTGDKKYMTVSEKFNHQKVILNIANGKDVLYGRHVNMQVPTFVGTARQYQLTGDETSGKATANFLGMIYKDHMSVIGGSGRYERYGPAGETTNELGFTADETCATYNMLKVAMEWFKSTGDLKQMDYFEKALYNHILASQDPGSGGVTYYTSLMPGSFKSFSKGFDLTGVWCCVGTGMENHAKYGEAIYFHNDKDLYVNLFIPSQLQWKEKGLKLSMETSFPEEDIIRLKINENSSFNNQLCIRYPSWAKRSPRVWVNNLPVQVQAKPGDYIRLSSAWKAGDMIQIEMSQDYRLETAADDQHMAAICRGPLVMAGALGTDQMPGPDLVRHAHYQYRNWIPPTNDIPMLIADRLNLNNWIQPVKDQPLMFKTTHAGWLSDKPKEITLLPYYQVRHQRMNVYWKLYSKEELALRKVTVSDEVNPASYKDEQAHLLDGKNIDTSSVKDGRHFWENNRPGRFATNGGWFSYQLKLNKTQSHQYVVVTYWGSTERNHSFDILVNDRLLKTEDIYDRMPLAFFQETYELPSDLIDGKDTITLRFKAKEGNTAGPVYGIRVTSSPQLFNNYLFY